MLKTGLLVRDYRMAQASVLNHGLGYMSYGLNSLKGGYIGDYIGYFYRAYEWGY